MLWIFEICTVIWHTIVPTWLAQIKKRNEPIIRSTHERVDGFRIISHTHQWTRRLERQIGCIWVHDVPNVRICRHAGISTKFRILEIQIAITRGHLLARLGVPVNMAHGSFDHFLITKHRQTFRWRLFRRRGFAHLLKIILINVNRVILLQALAHDRPQRFHRDLEIIFLFRTFSKSLHVTLLRWVHVLWPAPLNVTHGAILGNQTLGIDLVFGHGGCGI